MAETQQNQDSSPEEQSDQEKPDSPEIVEAAPEAAPEKEQVHKMGLFQRLNPMNLFRKESPDMYLREGESLVEHHNLALATMAYQKAISLDDSRAEGYKGLGHVFLKKGGRTNLDLALKSFQEAAKRNPFDDQVYGISAKIFEKMGKMKEATLERKKMMIVKTLQSDARNPIANNNMGILLLQQGQSAQALSYFKKSIESNPNYDVALRNLATAHFKMAMDNKDPEQRAEGLRTAKTYVAKALLVNSSSASMMIHGKILVLEGRFEDALRVCEEAEHLDAGNKAVFALKQMVLEKLNRTRDAQRAYDSFQALSE